MNELNVLKWAAGSPMALPVIEDLDVDLLLEAVARHRLAGYFLRRLRDAPQPWLGDRLRAGIEELHHQYEQIV
jgi:hypothetical protein